MRNTLDLDRDAIQAFCRRHHIRKLAILGSALRDDFTPESDVDVLVEFDAGYRIGFIGFSRIEDELSKILRRKVDLNTPNSLSKYFRNEVLHEAEVIYEQT